MGNAPQTYGASFAMWSQCYLPPDTSERAPPVLDLPGRYLIYLPLNDGRLVRPIAARPEIEPRTASSQVQRPNRYATESPDDAVWIFLHVVAVSVIRQDELRAVNVFDL